MKWSKEKPTKAGYYWYYPDIKRHPNLGPTIYEIVKFIDDPIFYITTKDDYLIPVEKSAGLWSGPIEEPTFDG